ncbi:MAG: DUF2933 domain-containing protein [Alphaproteobacteria bacterium]|jgi:hypothetical protein
MTGGRARTLIAVSVLVIVGFYVLHEHGGHALGLAPYLLLLLCPLLHLFHGHGPKDDGHGYR